MRLAQLERESQESVATESGYRPTEWRVAIESGSGAYGGALRE